MLYSLDEICLLPTSVSDVEHRKDVVVFDNHNKFPLFTSPMSCIVDEHNYSKFVDHNINAIIPRTVDWLTRVNMIIDGCWVAVGLKEAQWVLDAAIIPKDKIRLCIDQANGHMSSLLKLCSQLKDRFDDKIRIMTGNIAHWSAYREYARAGVDFVRCAVGTGSCCTTSVQTGMHCPMGSLIIKCREEKQYIEKSITLGAKFRSVPRIVADGGFKRIDQVVKALALGADYVMLGEVLAQSEEACGKTKKSFDGFKDINMREYFGMSTEKAQILVNAASPFKVENFVPKHSEGQVRYVEIKYKLTDWLADFEHALRSSMSYAGARTLEKYKGYVNWDIMTPVTYNAYMK